MPAAADRSAALRAAADEALRLFPQPVAVVGVARDGELGGLTAAWVTRVSMDPPLVLVSVGQQRRTYDLLEGAREFTVSLLAEGQVPEARLFGLHSRRDRDKWAETPHVLLGEGVPALERCAARLLCAAGGTIHHRRPRLPGGPGDRRRDGCGGACAPLAGCRLRPRRGLRRGPPQTACGSAGFW